MAAMAGAALIEQRRRATKERVLVSRLSSTTPPRIARPHKSSCLSQHAQHYPHAEHDRNQQLHYAFAALTCQFTRVTLAMHGRPEQSVLGTDHGCRSFVTDYKCELLT